MSSIASGRVSANIAVRASGSSHAPSRALSIAGATKSRRITRSDRRPEPRRGMKLQYFRLITSRTPGSSHSASMYCGYTHSRSVSAWPFGWSSLRIRCGDGNGCSGEMWSPFADRPAEVGRALLDQRKPPVGEVRRDLDADVGHQALGRLHELLHVVQRDWRGPRWRINRWSLVAGRWSVLCLVGYFRGFRSVVARVWDEVLEDHLLEVAVFGVHLGERFERMMRSAGDSPIPTRIPLVKGIFSSPAARIVPRRTSGCFVGEPW